MLGRSEGGRRAAGRGEAHAAPCFDAKKCEPVVRDAREHVEEYVYGGGCGPVPCVGVLWLTNNQDMLRLDQM